MVFEYLANGDIVFAQEPGLAQFLGAFVIGMLVPGEECLAIGPFGNDDHLAIVCREDLVPGIPGIAETIALISA